MVQKLFSLVDQTSAPDNSDSLQNQEILLPGHLITIYLKVDRLLTIWRFFPFLLLNLKYLMNPWNQDNFLLKV